VGLEDGTQGRGGSDGGDARVACCQWERLTSGAWAWVASGRHWAGRSGPGPVAQISLLIFFKYFSN
jgi:hypothetical protein